LLKSLCQSVIVFSESDASSLTWPTGDRATATFGARTPHLAPLVSFQRAHVLHGDAPSRVDASISSLPRLSRQKRARSELTAASSLRRARVRSSLHRSPPNSTHSSVVSRSPLSTL